MFQFSNIFYKRFIKEYGSILCCNVQKKIFGKSFNLMDAEEYDEFEKSGANIEKCPKIAGNVTKWTADIIVEKLKNR